ncbi:MAG: PqqD family protein [Planctomycetota bacterium]
MSKGWIKADGLVWEELGTEALVVNPRSRMSWILNPVAAHIWKHCEGAVGIRDLARVFALRGGAELATIERELSEFFQGLAQSGLVEAASSMGTPVSTIACFGGNYSTPLMSARALGANARRRPSPRGNSGPG